MLQGINAQVKRNIMTAKDSEYVFIMMEKTSKNYFKRYYKERLETNINA